MQQKTLVVEAGETYRFKLYSAHPLKFSTTENGTHGGGTEYTTGVTDGGTHVEIVMPNSSSITTLYYYCSAHPNMGGKILIKNQSATSNISGSGLSGGGGGSGPGYAY